MENEVVAPIDNTSVIIPVVAPADNAPIVAPAAEADAPVEDDKGKKDEKKAFIYKGEVIEAKELINKKDIPLQLLEIEVPEVGNKFGKAKAKKLPRLLVLTGVSKSIYGDKCVQINYASYLKDFKAGTASVPSDFKVKTLTGRMGRDILAKYDGHQMINLAQNLHSGGFMLGSDPEIFVEDEQGLCIPAFKFLGSKKDGKDKTRNGLHGGSKMYWDGFAAEFETSAVGCLAYHVDSIRQGLGGVLDAARKFNKNAKLSIKNVMDVPFDVLQEADQKFIEFGCMPSLNIYGLEGKTAPPRELPFRMAGGHIHFGIGKQSKEMVAEIVKSLDAILSVACVSLFAAFDNPIRKEFYGLPGEYRLPAHGLEYRALSNALLIHPTITNMTIDLARKVLAFGQKGLRKHWKVADEETIEVVRYCDVDRARKIMEANKAILCAMFKSAYHDDAIAQACYDVFYNGMDNALKDTDIAKNWSLDGQWGEHNNGDKASVKTNYAKLAAGKKI